MTGTVSYSRNARTSYLGLLCIALLACSGTDQTAGTSLNKAEAPPAFPTDFTPNQPLPDPVPPSSDKPGLAYLQAVHQRLSEPWRTFLEDCRLRLPPNNALNNPRLEVVVRMNIGADGQLHSAAIDKRSGRPEFDQVALEVIRENAPYPKPPIQLMSDDDRLHLHWQLSRDRRQAGVATAELQKVKYLAGRAVPKYLARNDLATAAYRLLEEAQQKGVSSNPAYVKLGRLIAEATIREALSSDQPATQRQAIEAASAIRMVSAAQGLRNLLQTSVDIGVRARAIRALGTIGDRGAAELLLSTLKSAKGSGIGGKHDASIASAASLAAIGSGELAESTILGWFNEKNKQSLWAALVVMSEFPVPSALPKLRQMIGDSQRSRKVRMAACTAIGASTNRENGKSNMNALRARLKDSDGALRAACIKAIGEAARRGARSRFTYWKVVELLKKDRDERVRAAAVRAAVVLEPGLFHSELYVLRKERSSLVLTALAEGLARVPDVLAYQKLVKLAAHENPQIRRQAVASLVRHPDSRARKVAAQRTGDADLMIRLSAIRALDAADALQPLLVDESQEVRRVAFATLVRVAGQASTLERMLRTIIDSPPRSMDRAQLVSAWLAPNRP